jgi:hypothetical protein
MERQKCREAQELKYIDGKTQRDRETQIHGDK